MAEVLAAYEQLVEEKQEKVRERDQPSPQLAWDGRLLGDAHTPIPPNRKHLPGGAGNSPKQGKKGSDTI